MNLLLKIETQTGDTFDFLGNLDKNIYHPLELAVKKDGKKFKNFSQSFYCYSADEAYKTILSHYVNGSTNYKFLFVCEMLEQHKQNIQTYNTKTDREVPNIIVTPHEETARLVAISESGGYYWDKPNNLFVYCDKNNIIVADMEAFVLSYFVAEYKENRITYLSPSTKRMMMNFVSDMH